MQPFSVVLLIWYTKLLLFGPINGPFEITLGPTVGPTVVVRNEIDLSPGPNIFFARL